jgi:integrase
VQARIAGKKRRLTLGFAADMPLSKARAEAVHALSAMRQGIDPSAERKARQRAVVAKGMTFRQLAEQWLKASLLKLKPRTAADYQEILNKHILPVLGTKLAGEIEHDDVEQLHLDMAKTPRRANYTIAVIRIVMNYAEKKHLRSPHTNPCVGLKLYRENARERFLSEAEIGMAADAITQAEGSGKIGPFAAAGLRLALFTGARSGEITAMQWHHVDWDRRLVRLPDSKTNEPRTIHLSDAAVEVLRKTPHASQFVIASNQKDKQFAKLSRAWIVARKFAGLDDVRLHDLRHSYASLAAGRGVPLQVIGKLLGHKVMATTQRYAHLARDLVADVNDQLGVAMQAAITKPRSEIVELPRRRSRTSRPSRT